MTDYTNYHTTRFGFDSRRNVMWRTLARHFFQSYLPGDNGAVLELGAGYCDLINSFVARHRFALDIWPGIADHAENGVQTIVGNLDRISEIEDASLDLIVASNLFEHISQTALADCIALARRKLRPGGRLIALQPNYKYAYADYFDDYTHVAIWSHISLGDFFTSNGLHVERVIPRFLPLTLKSRFPVHPLLIRAYLASPVKLMGKQMLIVAQNPPLVSSVPPR
jgi:SAM-dependent methyltransferase